MIKIKVDFSKVGHLFKNLEKELKHTKSGARAGYLKGDKRDDGLTEGEVAISNEFGTDTIPPRPFLRKARKNLEKELLKVVESGLEDELPFNNILGRCALKIRNEIIESIDSNIPPPNAPATIAQKGSNHTLIDTGQLRNSVHSAVVIDGEERLRL